MRHEDHYRFLRSGDELVSLIELRFRSREDLARSLAQAGFEVEDVFGDWGGSDAVESSPELIFVARRV